MQPASRTYSVTLHWNSASSRIATAMNAIVHRTCASGETSLGPSDSGSVNPSLRITRHAPHQQRSRWSPPRRPAEFPDMTQCLCALLELEVTQIFLHDDGHRHAQGGGKILPCHASLFFRVCKKTN